MNSLSKTEALNAVAVQVTMATVRLVQVASVGFSLINSTSVVGNITKASRL